MSISRPFFILVLSATTACGNEVQAPGIDDLALGGDDDSGSVSQAGDGGVVEATGSEIEPQDNVDPAPETEPTASGLPVTLTALSSTSQSALAGTRVDEAPRVVVLDDSNRPVQNRIVRFSVSGGGAISQAESTTDSSGIASLDGWRLGRRVVANTVTARLAANSAIAPVEFDATVRTDYSITVAYLSSVTTAERAAFENAATRWSAVVINELPNFSVRRSDLIEACGGDSTATQRIDVDDILIFASVVAIDGEGGVLGQASPCYQHSSGAIAIGIMAFDSADMDFLASSGKLEDTILHEMGHVIGIGSLWEREGLVESPSLGNPGANTRFRGEQAALAYSDAGGTGFDGLVPVENSGRQGSADSHWRESVFRNELMSSSINGTEASLPLSAITIASLSDLGFYAVNEAASDPFSFTSTLQRSEPSTPIMQCSTGTIERLQ
ncbi:MAG: Ig-like domain-containing protein [Clostridia bacterium]|nr:Ig-like domain-containing protein [Deltaproteobacteria bacterium]